VARLAKNAPVERVWASARALLPPDAAAVESAHRALALAWRSEHLPLPAAAEITKRATDGEAEAAVAFALVRLEDSIARRQTGLAVAQSALPILERARRAAPSSLLPWIAHAYDSVATDDLATAEEDLRVLREVAPESTLVLGAASALATARGDRDLARALDKKIRELSR
jgi:hypothetical protein